MPRLVALVALLLLGACASPAPSPTSRGPSTTPEPPVIDCGEIADIICDSVADAAELMTGTAAVSVFTLPTPSDGGMSMQERYVVALEAVGGEVGSQLVEVVRFEGSDDWSVRRLEAMPTD